jgi:spore coat polysaccharide biosynthesis protein SpsF
MKLVGIVQARMGSTRLPGKVLRDLCGAPMLSRVVSRTLRSNAIDLAVVATTVDPADDAIEHLCVERGWHCFRGDEDDVLDRYYRTAVAYEADVVVRITSDCPLIEPKIVDQLVQEFMDLQPRVDYACNMLPNRTFPRGLDTEVMRFDALEKAWKEDTNPAWREHVTPYIWRHADLFTIHGLVNDEDLSHMRWTVDTEDDLNFVNHIYRRFSDDTFSWRQVLALLAQHREWLQINGHVAQKVLP